MWSECNSKEIMEAESHKGTENTRVINNSSDSEDFNFSELGTKEHWTEIYTQELNNFEENGDIGDVWFGEESVLRIIDWMKANGSLKNCSVLDIGCGNGITLSYLADEGFSDLYGIDYCEEAIKLARGVAEKRNTPITYEVGNVLEIGSNAGLLSRKYDICHDKGTYDAISLIPNKAKECMRTYIANVCQLLNSEGLFVITSCNWTEMELLSKFNKYFEKVETIPTPVFQFGGKIGTNVTSLVLKKLD